MMSERNKRIAIAFHQKTLNEFDAATAAAQHGGKRYIQHNPLVEDGFEGMGKFVDWIRANYPEARTELKRVFADGDFVILHSRWIRAPGARGDAVVDIFRLENGKIVEHWDVIQPIPETSANGNTMF